MTIFGYLSVFFRQYNVITLYSNINFFVRQLSYNVSTNFDIVLTLCSRKIKKDFYNLTKNKMNKSSLKIKSIFMQNILTKKRLRCITICNTKKSFKINELLVEQLRNTEFRNTKFLILLSRQIKHFLRFWLESQIEKHEYPFI